MKRLNEILFGVGFIALLLAPVFIFNAPKVWWVFWLAVIVTVLVFEVVSIAWTKKHIGKGRTISQQFWDWSKTYKVKAIVVLVCWTAGWILLMVHLAAKLGG